MKWLGKQNVCSVCWGKGLSQTVWCENFPKMCFVLYGWPLLWANTLPATRLRTVPKVASCGICYFIVLTLTACPTSTGNEGVSRPLWAAYQHSVIMLIPVSTHVIIYAGRLPIRVYFYSKMCNNPNVYFTPTTITPAFIISLEDSYLGCNERKYTCFNDSNKSFWKSWIMYNSMTWTSLKGWTQQAWQALRCTTTCW